MALCEKLLEVAPQRTDGQVQSVRRVCFVCTGNTCRSPMAEAVANAILKEVNATAPVCVEAFSAGLYAVEGEPISPLARLALENADVAPISGHDYRTHTAHTITATEAEQFDLLIPMSRTHAMELIFRFPNAVRRIVCMPREIPDPYGGDAQVYADTLAEIEAGVRELLQGVDLQ